QCPGNFQRLDDDKSHDHVGQGAAGGNTPALACAFDKHIGNHGMRLWGTHTVSPCVGCCSGASLPMTVRIRRSRFAPTIFMMNITAMQAPMEVGTAAVPSTATRVKRMAPEEKKLVIIAPAENWNMAKTSFSFSLICPSSDRLRVRD